MSGGLYLVASGRSQAELLGLRWRDIDLEMLSLSVSQVLYKRRGIYARSKSLRHLTVGDESL